MRKTKKAAKMPYKAKSLDTRATETGCHEVRRKIAVDRGGAPIAGRCVDGKRVCLRVYRIKWEEIHGPVPTGEMLVRTCKNAACVNPEHRRLCRSYEERAVVQGKVKTRDRKREIRENGPKAQRRKNLHPDPLPSFRDRREKAGIPITEMSERLDVDLGHLSRLERGLGTLIGFQRELGERYLAICAAGPLTDPVYPGEITRHMAAKRLGVSHSTLRGWEKKGLLPQQKHGRHVYYRETDLVGLRKSKLGPKPGARAKQEA